MATPLTSGAVGLLRQHVRKKRVAGGPTAALLKALLIASTVRLTVTGPKRVVDNDQGYGLINLASALKPSKSRKLRMHNVSPGLSTGEAWNRTIRVSGSAPLRVVLAYSDFPGPALVNNLNLMVTAPDGTRFVGNQAQSGSVTLDSANNVELVDVPSAATGEWRIDVVGANVPEGPQEFALVIIGRTA